MTKCSPAIPVLVQDEGGRAEVGQVRLYGPIALEELEEIRSQIKEDEDEDNNI